MDVLTSVSVLERSEDPFAGRYFRIGNQLDRRARLFYEAIETVFGSGGKKAAYYRDFALIAAFLSMERLFEMVFRKMDKDLEGIWDVRLGFFHDYQNVLTKSFFDLLNCYGESAFPRVHSIVLVGSSANVFGPIVSSGYLFKDGTGPNHGEYSHTIQWLCVAKARDMGILKLEHSVFDIYCNTAGPGSLSSRALLRDERASTKVTFWQYLVDCFPESEGDPEHLLANLMSESYRTPSYLTCSLLSGALSRTFLGKHLSGRRTSSKRTVGTSTEMRGYHLEKQRRKGSLYSTQDSVNVAVPDVPLTAPLIKKLAEERKVEFKKE